MKLRIFIEPQQGATYEQQVRMAQKAEALGFDAFFRSDHYLTMGGDGLPGPTDAWVTLAGLARETDAHPPGHTRHLGHVPAAGDLAITVAQVDAMSGGRVELGLGAGWFDGEHEAYGVPFPPLGERFERLEEQFAILTGMWDYSGRARSSTSRGSTTRSRTARRCPSRYSNRTRRSSSGGGGPTRTPRLAATYAAEFNLPFSSLADTEAQFIRVRAACEQRAVTQARCASRRPRWCAAAPTRPRSRARPPSIGRKAEELRTNGAAGTPDEVVARLQAFGLIGAETIYLQVLDLDDLEHVELIAHEVLPKVS